MSSERVQPRVDDPRTIRAATEHMTVIEEARAFFEVITSSGDYRVDLAEPACTCPDFQYREEVQECKHIRRVRLQFGQVDVDELESELTARIRELEADAAELEKEADGLIKEASDLGRTIDRLHEVVR